MAGDLITIKITSFRFAFLCLTSVFFGLKDKAMRTKDFFDIFFNIPKANKRTVLVVHVNWQLSTDLSVVGSKRMGKYFV